MLSVFLQSATSEIASFLPLIAIFAVMYFFFLRPQMKRQKEETAFRKEIVKGSKIVTTSGIHGKIVEVGETTVIIESENTRLKIERAAVSKEMSAQYEVKA